jgi:hypothetical protein
MMISTRNGLVNNDTTTIGTTTGCCYNVYDNNNQNNNEAIMENGTAISICYVIYTILSIILFLVGVYITFILGHNLLFWIIPCIIVIISGIELENTLTAIIKNKVNKT